MPACRPATAGAAHGIPCRSRRAMTTRAWAIGPCRAAAGCTANGNMRWMRAACSSWRPTGSASAIASAAWPAITTVSWLRCMPPGSVRSTRAGPSLPDWT
ncbi:hypothetical protein G6F23_015305 [Rhizopus arrhizus]|nr:hypothetical protein G6F23_015305 [Rhizopus arrhizus]